MTQSSNRCPSPIRVSDLPVTRGSTGMPRVFRPRFEGRLRTVVGDAVGLTRFGVNLLTLEPGASSSVRHWHTHEDEFVYVLSGTVTLMTEAGSVKLDAGTAAGFPAGVPDGHRLVNEGEADAVLLEVGGREAEDDCFYPDDDMQILHSNDGPAVFTHRDGTPFED